MLTARLGTTSKGARIHKRTHHKEPHNLREKN